MPLSPINFLPIFEKEFAPLVGLEHRAPGFRVIFTHLQEKAMQRPSEEPLLILETGSMRQADNWLGDGQSTYLWKVFGEFFPCEIHTVDLAPEAAVLVKETCGRDVEAHTGDSVAWLYNWSKRFPGRLVDLLYLDSFDLDLNDTFPSAFHHIKELMAIAPCIGPGTIIAIDDNLQAPGSPAGILGKGMLVKHYFDNIQISPLHLGYQVVWKL